MQFASNLTTLMQRVMAMRSPEVTAVLPKIEAMEQQERIRLVQQGHDNLSSLIKHWDKFSDVLVAQRGLSKAEVKKKAKELKEIRQKLDWALRLVNPKMIPAPFRPQCQSAFDILAAWFLVNQGYLGNVLSRESIARQDVEGLDLSAAPVSLFGDGLEIENPVGLEDAVVAPRQQVRSVREEDQVDVLDAAGLSFSH
ncbi:hypothetical protein [Sphingosinicella sp. BN140058]|uniref:hypothetical protein n=1 Tax=Sphingosinicella sp. BN140058 TaxID=1892855 RepID=UPI0010130F2D|nr:hypothetical protein [Sphingosinicella sp. BN140058]QAY80117.1 hypothetical protein ETR14_26100 [Sphingosinicella sp. BN140058]